MIQKLPFVAALLLAASIACAQDWSHVTSLPAGSPVEVIHGKLQRAQGILASTTSDAITVRTEQGEATIPRADVRRVSLRATSRGRRAVMGALIGAAAIGATTAIWGHSGDIDIRRDFLFGIGAVAGGAVGAGVGAATGGPHTIYRAP